MSSTRSILSAILCLLALGIVVIGVPGIALAREKPAYSEMLVVGPYVVEVDFAEYPPQIEQPLNITVVAQNHLPLSGQVTAQPGPGTDGVTIHTPFTSTQKEPWILVSSIHLPVRGAWHLVFDLDGTRGRGTASMDITVTAPNAMSPWLGWLIGLSPLVGCTWLVWRQWKYRRTLLTKLSQQE